MQADVDVVVSLSENDLVCDRLNLSLHASNPDFGMPQNVFCE
jgi:hypothetical protein